MELRLRKIEEDLSILKAAVNTLVEEYENGRLSETTGSDFGVGLAG